MIWNSELKLKKLILTAICALSIVLCYTTSAYGAIDIKITSYSYQTHFVPGETVSFDVSARNNGTNTINYAYVGIVLTNRSTNVATEHYSPSVLNITAGSTATFATVNWTALEGAYTVTIILQAWDPDLAAEVRGHTAYGSEPLDIGRAEEYVSAFPNIIDLGVLPYGRYMYPNPIKIHWNFYLKNRLRKSQPWYMRIYTDNSARYKGIEGGIYQSRRSYITSKIWVRSNVEGSPSGLVSSDGKYTLPLRVWCLNYGPDWDEIGWSPTLLGPPPVNDDYVWKGPLLDDGKRDYDRQVWSWVPDYVDMTADSRTWRSLIGKDPYNRNFLGDNNPTGDFTLDSPFDIYFATEASPTTVVGKYSGKLIIEIYTP